jgi:hypothetical protein
MYNSDSDIMLTEDFQQSVKSIQSELNNSSQDMEDDNEIS